MEFLAVIEARFVEPSEANISETRQAFLKVADADERRDRGGLLALLELERRAREQNLGPDFGMQTAFYPNVSFPDGPCRIGEWFIESAKALH